MANCLSYSLFGYNETHENCFDFRAYFRYLGVNLRMKELIYPEWDFHIITDVKTLTSPYHDFFEYHIKHNKIKVEVVESGPLCLMMLRRMMPIFGPKVYDRVLCRDLDSLITYRERQAVEYWIQKGHIAHAITDSVSHTIPLMGGMIGFISKEFREKIKCDHFEAMINLSPGIDYRYKGSDQEFLNRAILPRIADSITEHYILGMPQSFRGDCHHEIQDILIPGLDEFLKESNHLVNHIGQAGCALEPVLKFFDQYMTDEQQEYFNKIEQKYKEVFFWHL